jgi:hypothetical protein
MAKGSFAEFYQTLVDMGAAYARNTSVGATPEWRSVLPAGTRFLLLPLSAGLLGAALVRERRPQWALLIAHILASAVVVALPNKYFQHYFQLYLSPVAIVAGAGLAALNGDGRRWLVPRIAGIAVVLAWLGWRELPFYRLPADEWSRAKYGPLYVDIRELSGKINSVLAPGETFYEYGNESGFYFYTRRTPPSGMISNFGLVDGPYKLQYDRQVIQQLDKAVPEMTIVAKYMARGPVTDWIAERYIMIWQSDTFVILARRNGKLEQRLAAK